MSNKAIRKIKLLVDEQSEDKGLWFNAEIATEAYLQSELRRLHAAIEGELWQINELRLRTTRRDLA